MYGYRRVEKEKVFDEYVLIYFKYTFEGNLGKNFEKNFFQIANYFDTKFL